MKAEIYWIEAPMPGRLAVMPRPRGGDWLGDEVRNWRQIGVDTVVSLLEASEIDELELAGEQSLCESAGICFRALPIADRGVPGSNQALAQLARELAQELANGRNVAIHCRQGIGRAPLVAIGALISAGIDPKTATRTVSAARGRPVPETAEQSRWLADFAREATEWVQQ